MYLLAIWYILGSFGIFLPVLVCFTKTNLATLAVSEERENIPAKEGILGQADFRARKPDSPSNRIDRFPFS
jgi:hypothetical protein